MQSHLHGIYGIEEVEIDDRPHVAVNFVHRISPLLLCMAITLDTDSGRSIEHIQLLTFQCNRAAHRNHCMSTSRAFGLSVMTHLPPIFYTWRARNSPAWIVIYLQHC